MSDLRGSSIGDGDVEVEVVEAFDEGTLSGFAGAFVDVGGAEIAIGDVVFEDVVDAGEERVADGDGSALSAEAAAEVWFRERPGNTYAHHTRIYTALLLGDLELAEQRLRATLQQLQGESYESYITSFEGILHARRHHRDLALDCVRRAIDSPRSFGHTHHTYYNIACVHAVLGDLPTAMAWLERSVDTGFAAWPFFLVDPHLEHLRDEPAFKRLVAGLEERYRAVERSNPERDGAPRGFGGLRVDAARRRGRVDDALEAERAIEEL